MAETEAKPKNSIFVELMKRKAEAQKSGRKFGVLGRDLSGQFHAGEQAQPIIRRGGRNGSGKP